MSDDNDVRYYKQLDLYVTRKDLPPGAFVHCTKCRNETLWLYHQLGRVLQDWNGGVEREQSRVCCRCRDRFLAVCRRNGWTVHT